MVKATNMDSDYDRKFEEMKMYIPFLESMIKRLESTSSNKSNPRQAQLDKIRSLRDLLLDKKKRMKMENLLKCEQVLINLYAKVEQRDYIAGTSTSNECVDTLKSKELPDLETVRNKLKFVSKREEAAETLPEIARASQIEEVCTPGSKEPALFQRRPNKSSLSPVKNPITHENMLKSPTKSQSRRSYTRVLVSPETRRWSQSENVSDKLLFSRRSPRRSPRRYSPSYHKKERKKYFKQESQSRKSKDLNITLNVPEESLNSLNTKDILSRIINCSDGDVDIDTLRELRTQILGELKQTGAKDDISDLILKSYKNKKSTNTIKKKREDVEEGEISDSESEAIESIYGSLVVVEKEKNDSNKVKTPTEKDINQARKIQICLVINSDKDNASSSSIVQEGNENQQNDVPDFQMYDDNNCVKNKDSTSTDLKDAVCKEADTFSDEQKDKANKCILNDEHDTTAVGHTVNSESVEPINKDSSTYIDSDDLSIQAVENKVETVQFKANFYKPLKEQKDLNEKSLNECTVDKEDNKTVSTQSNEEDGYNKMNMSIEKIDSDTMPMLSNENDVTVESLGVVTNAKDPVDVLDMAEKKEDTEIPLLNEPTVPAKPAELDVLSEIDILQALKNEILSETIAIPGSETGTPALHQPKITKVASAQEILPKKRISIEKYKQNSASSSKQSLFLNEDNAISKDEFTKKQSLKLTEKECERFNLTKLSLNDEDSSDNEEKSNLNISLNDIYGDLAPESPDHDLTEIEITSPVIIPVDPVKTTVVSCQSDIDMRNLIPKCSPNALSTSVASSSTITSSSPSLTIAKPPESLKNDTKLEQNKNSRDKVRILLVDPRVKRDQSVNKDSASPLITNPDRTPISTITNDMISVLTPNMTPTYNSGMTTSYNPNMTPNYNPSMTPSYNPSMTAIITPNARTYEMTPTHQPYEIDGSIRKHIYAPTFPIFDQRESREQPVPKEGPIRTRWDKTESITENRRSVWDDSDGSQTRKWDNRDPRGSSVQKDLVLQNSRNHDSYKYHKNTRNDKHNIDKRDSYRIDCPRTPVPSFGWSDGPTTPTDQFGILDVPTTPLHPFGRSDCPPTPSHPFGRSECPLTPSHPFGRSDNIMTPSHPFGRSDNTHKFNKDPRLNRMNKVDYDSSSQYDERDRGYHHDRGFNRGSSHKPQNRSYSNSDSFRNNERDQSGINDAHRYYSKESSGAHFNRDHSVSRSFKDSEDDRLFIRDRRRYGDKSSMSYEEVGSRRSYQREKSVGRSMSEVKFSRSSRAHGVGRSCVESDADKTLAVKPHAGRSFTINTSVNTTFQDLIASGKGIQVFDYSFDPRRQRATSVGRSSVGETSLGLILPEKNDIPEYKDKNSRFKRASSVGRELSNSKSNKSFQEVKAEFESYRNTMNLKKFDIVTNTKLDIVSNKSQKNENDSKQPLKSSYLSPRSRKTNYTSPQDLVKPSKHTNLSYSPRKNYRDPRMRRDHRDFKNKNVFGDRRDLRNQKNYGIVYSSDNIAKGILGSGYGVKNYKIPKLKRPPEEIEELAVPDKTEINDKTGTKDGKESTLKKKQSLMSINKSKESNCEKKDKESKLDVTQVVKNKKPNTENKLNKIINDSPKRITRSTKMNDVVETKPLKDDAIVITRKSRKPIIYDSDSDTENNETDSVQSAKSTLKISNEQIISVESEPNKQNEEPLDSSFGMDDMEIFNDNIVTDPVIDNINALIADLDHDLDASKVEEGSNFGTEIPFEKMFENITSAESNVIQPLTGDTLGDISEVIEKDLSKNDKDPLEISIKDKIQKKINNEISHADGPDAKKEKVDLSSEKENNSIELSTPIKKMTENNQLPRDIINEIKKAPSDNVNNEDIVSTTDTEKGMDITEDKGKLDGHLDDHSNDGHHVPDSTINKNNEVSNQSAQESVPNSAYGVQNLMNSDVTSTYDLSEAISKDNSEPGLTQKVVPAIDSIGSLLSILQDKSKIKELLNMLGDKSSDNEKIKKKLEKLSEIVSDEDSNDSLLNSKKEAKSSKVTSDCVYNKQPATTQIMDVELEIKEKATDEKETSVLECNNQLVENIKEVNLEVKQKTIDETMEKIEVKANVINETINLKKSNEDSSPTHPYSQPAKNHQNGDGERIEKEVKDLIMDETAENLALGEQKEMDKKNYTNDIKDHENKDTETSRKCAKHITKNVNAIDTEKQEDTELQEHENHDEPGEETAKTKKMPLKKTRAVRKGKGRFAKKPTIGKEKRLTRAGAASVQIEKPVSQKKPSRELLKLQEDIKEMFLSNDILNDTGIRMCRLAKLVDEKNDNKKEDSYAQDSGPVVVLEKCKNAELEEVPERTTRKKPGPKSKSKVLVKDTSVDAEIKKDKPNAAGKYKPGPKSKTKHAHKSESSDPYAFETDSVGDTSMIKEIEAEDNSSDSESDSLASSRSYGSTEVLADLKKKPKRKRRGWQVGVIKSKHKKKKDNKSESSMEDDVVIPQRSITIPDFNCFTDKTYCFQKNIFTYSCRLCEYRGTDIVHHYKKQHPHSEIPLSRMNPSTAKEAIEQCEQINFQAITKIPTEKYVCRFCFKEFSKTKAVLEKFFWHVVSMHTGEYKQICSQCVNVTRCPFHLDIPPPPKDIKGQLIGYICGKCNYIQISLENLKTHVIVRHNDEQTEVYTINLAAISKKVMSTLTRRCQVTEAPRVLRSSRSNQSVTEISDDRNDVTENSDRVIESGATRRRPVPFAKDTATTKTTKASPIQSKLTFENDDVTEVAKIDNAEQSEKGTVKIEPDDHEAEDQEQTPQFDVSLNNEPVAEVNFNIEREENEQPSGVSDDIMDYPHFKFHYTETGNKEYVCCINGNDSHYKTALMISMKKHVQTKHSENWDGYCCLCKVIVTPQGVHCFKDCLQHFLDKHLDNFPVLEKRVEKSSKKQKPEPPVVTGLASTERTGSPKTYINVRPLADLISKESPHENTTREEKNIPFPKIESVMSLGSPSVEPPLPSPSYPSIVTTETHLEKNVKYEEVQAEVMSRKHRVVLDTMMAKNKLVKVFKCAGRFCSFTSDSAEDALLHASTHQRVGGENALDCSYCDFDAAKNAIDLVMHVFKIHSRCQYSCSQCFYRAAANQLVGAHYARVHGGAPIMGSVLRTTAITTPVVEDSANLLSREDAVPYYVCNHGDGSCKFRTYTHGKFFEHLLQKHNTATSHPCSLCSTAVPSPEELINHMKSHGLKLYQCTWCIHGANSEPELLDHTSAQHPTKQPQAYLRIITNKDGSLEMRVLPLAYLNKTKVPTEDVTPCNIKENPVREAERSIELEKLIGHTTMMIESAELLNASSITSVVDNQTQNVAGDICFKTNSQPQEPIVSEILPVFKSFLETSSSDIPLDQDEVESREMCIAPVVKAEIVEPTSPKGTPKDNVIYCLDSDEEDSRQSVIDLSDDDAIPNPYNKSSTTVFNKISLPLLYRCPTQGCNVLCRKLTGFKKHMTVCGEYISYFHCPHKPCTTVLSSVNDVLSHYNEHLMSLGNKTINKFFCGVCNSNFSSIAGAKKHAKGVHKVLKFNVTSGQGQNGEVHYTVRENHKEVQRKRSVETTKRYGPDDIDQLPINPILDTSVHCALCEFSTKVRLNMARHLQLHNEQQPVPQTAPVNPVPHLETNEKHFDRMVNLASSSVVTRGPDKQPRSESTPVVSLLIPPEAVSRYPKYVPERQRYTCGAKGCSYISVDEGMFKCHWDTLHTGSNDYRCVHCPPTQHVDTSQPLSAARIIAHLKMHGVTLYGCSACSYYHCKKEIVEKHASTHKGGQALVVREEWNAQAAPSTTQMIAPTMDLKPWQCGQCKFKSMLRPEVVDHCAKFHQSKMQYKCAYCPFRTSTVENITKHQSNSHPGKPEEVFFYYYREGSVADDADGTPRWQKQRQKCGNTETQVKTEAPESISATQATVAAPVAVDLNLVKKEFNEVDSPVEELTVDDLCKRFGQFCEPNGLKYKCSLCKVVVEQNREVMQSHLYEELKYRKWGCRICSYKAFHRTGLNDHMASEHSRQYQDPIELPIDVNIEKWVANLLDHQAVIIDKHQDNLSKQKLQFTNIVAGPSSLTPQEIHKTSDTVDKHVTYTLKEAFGQFGAPSNMQYCCPKCNYKVKDEASMKDHLESELTKIRWCCTKCGENYQTYHEAQLHCKSVHPGQAAQPKEAIRDPLVRNSWITNVIQTQKQSMSSTPVSEPATPEKSDMSDAENSLLVVRYEEKVATPEEIPMNRKRPAPSPDSDDERLVIDEQDNAKKKVDLSCVYCDFTTKYRHVIKEHTYRHYNLKPFTCMYCEFSGHRATIVNHVERCHAGMPQRMKSTELPPETPPQLNILKTNKKPAEDEAGKTICLTCEKNVPETEVDTHNHEKGKAEFAKKGSVVVKCCICLVLRIDVKSLQEHHNTCHPDIPINYAYFKLHYDTREINYCGHCNKRFKFLRDLKTHHNAMHSSLQITYTTTPYCSLLNSSTLDEEVDTSSKKRESDSQLPPSKRFARKSTTKLPRNNVARKSTTKLPNSLDLDSDSEAEPDYSYYGTKPSKMARYANVSMLMPMCNTLVPITMKKLSGIIKINPKVVVKDFRKYPN